MSICEHVGPEMQYMVVEGRPRRDMVEVMCPCCRLRAYREPDDDLEGDACPYCAVNAVPAPLSEE